MTIYQEIWDGPGRNYKKENGAPMERAKWYVVVHNTSNDATAAEEADYAKVRTDGTGSHYFTDNIEIRQSTDTARCVGHVGSNEGNERGLSYEITGFNNWSRDHWLANVAWDRLAAQMARDCAEFGIPVRLLTIDQMRAFSSDLKGFVTHDMCRQAWGDTTHTDPGPNFPLDHLLSLVAAHINGGDDVSDAYELLVTGERPGKEDKDQTHSPDGGRYGSIPNTYMADLVTRAHLDARHAADGTDAIRAELTALRTTIEHLAEVIKNGGGVVDIDELMSRIDSRLAAQRAEFRDAVADLGEGGADAVRADA